MTRSKTFFYWILGFVFALAAVLRVVAFSYIDAFEDDECRLLLSYLDKSWGELFLSLGREAQSTPPIFLIIQKFWGYIFGFSEKSLHLIIFLNLINSY